MLDLAQAHLLALQHDGSDVFNLGSGCGYSVMEVIDTVKKVTGKDFFVKRDQRRPGDPARLIADSTKARAVLGWKPKYDNLEDIVASAWQWRLKHPDGYCDK